MVAKQAEETRQKILEAAQKEIHQRGYNAVSVADIVRASDLTKGGFYHHFASKEDLAKVLVRDVLREGVRRRWLEPLTGKDDPITALKDHLQHMRETFDAEEMCKGCPLNNLALELATETEVIRLEIAQVFQEWVDGFAGFFKYGQEMGTVRKDIHVQSAALFLVSALEGIIGLYKTMKEESVLEQCAQGLFIYLESLRVEKE